MRATFKVGPGPDELAESEHTTPPNSRPLVELTPMDKANVAKAREALDRNALGLNDKGDLHGK